VTNVGNTRELVAAVSEGARHIQITEHLDLTAIETLWSGFDLGGQDFDEKLAFMFSTWSIRVRPIPVCLMCFEHSQLQRVLQQINAMVVKQFLAKILLYCAHMESFLTCCT
jgi:hypothetical protein